MKQKSYFLVSGVIFLAVAVAHLSRIFTGWEIVLAGRLVPHWMSIIGLIVPGALSAWGFRLAARA